MMIHLLALALTGPGEFEAPFLAQAGGKPIEAQVGHLAPILYDFDRDGLPDLAVGTFAPGNIRLYRNVGEPGRPRFDKFVNVQAGGKEITVESG
jgi:hypothetical protein